MEGGDDYAERQARWSATTMTEKTKQWVRETMNRAVARTGVVTEATVAGLVKNSTITDKFRGGDLASAADVVWAWIAEEQAAESGRVAADLQRRSRAKNRRTLPRWRWYAQVRSGWERPAEMGRAQVVTMQEADRLLSLMWWKQEHRDWDSVDDSEVLRLRRGTVARVWSVVKRCGYQGKGGYGRYLQVLAVLMLWGEVEGSVGVSPKEDWWIRGQQQAALMGVQTVQETLEEELDWDVGSEGPDSTETVMDVVVDWMACTQSLKAAVPEGVIYLPYDRKTSHGWRLLLGAVGAGVGALCADDPGWWACMMVSHGARARGPPQLPAAIPSDNDHPGSWTPVRCQWRSRDGGFESRPPVADRRCRHRHCRCPLRAHPACLPLCGMGRCGACMGAKAPRQPVSTGESQG